MEKFIRRDEMKKYSLSHIESPFFALSHVERSLSRPMEISGLIDLIRTSNSSSKNCMHERDKARILDAVERGE